MSELQPKIVGLPIRTHGTYLTSPVAECPNEKLKEMALLNGGDLNQIILANTLIKVEKGN